jgi:hypothetical protein
LVYDVGAPSGRGNVLFGVSCPTTSFCEAVGQYADANGVEHPLVETSGTGGFQQYTPSLSGQNGFLSSVSCQSQSFCLAVGVENYTTTRTRGR